jgi:hypothetical protein
MESITAATRDHLRGCADGTSATDDLAGEGRAGGVET